MNLHLWEREDYLVNKAIISKKPISDEDKKVLLIKVEKLKKLIETFFDLQPNIELTEFLKGKKSDLDEIGLDTEYVNTTFTKILNLDARIRSTSIKIFKQILSTQSPSGSWNFLYHQQLKKNVSNPWITATCMFSLHKAKLLSLLPDDAVKLPIMDATDWLTKVAYLNTGRGWNNNPPELNDDTSEAKLIDTCYIIGILSRVSNNISKDILSNSLSFILEKQDKSGAWLDNESADIICTSYGIIALTLLNQKLSDYELKIPANLKKDIISAIESGVEYLMLMQRRDGCWSKTPTCKEGDVLATSLALQALRRYRLERSDYPVRIGCNWLMTNFEYCEDTWCWTEESMDKSKKIPSIEKTSAAVSTLLISSNFTEFSYVRVVLLWLLDQWSDYNQNIYMAYILCSLLDYLRAIYLEKEFFET